MGVADDDMIEDASDIEAKRLNEMKEKGNTSFLLYCTPHYSPSPSLPSLSLSPEEEERKTWSQAVQRGLPRPCEVNTSVLKGAPHRDQKYRDLYEVRSCFKPNMCSLPPPPLFPTQAEELIKVEMLQMLRHDIVNHPTSNVTKTKSYLTTLKTELEKKPLERFTQEELNEVTHSLSHHFIILLIKAFSCIYI